MSLATIEVILTRIGAVEAAALMAAGRAKKNPEPPTFAALWAVMPEHIKGPLRIELEKVPAIQAEMKKARAGQRRRPANYGD